MENWNRQWGKKPGSRIPVEKAIIGVVAVVSLGIFAYSRLQRDPAAPAELVKGRPFDGRMDPGRVAPLGAPADSIMVVAPPGGTAAPQAQAPRAVAASAPAGAAASAAAVNPGWAAPQAPAGNYPRLAPVAARPDPIGNLGAGSSAAMRGQASPGESQGLVARAIAAVARALPGGASARGGHSLRGFGGGLAAAQGGLGGAGTRPGPETASAAAATAAPAAGPASQGGGAAPGAPLASAKDSNPGGNPDHVSNTTPGTGGGGAGSGGITKQGIQYHRDDLRLRSRCLRLEQARPAVGLASSALKRRRDAAKKAAADLTTLTAKLRQPSGVGPELAMAAAGTAAPLDTDDSGQASPLTEVSDAQDRLDKSAACLDKLRKEDDLPHDAAAADQCHAQGLEGLSELSDAATRLDELRQSGAAQLDALYVGSVNRGDGSFKGRMESEALKRLETSYTQTISRALAEVKGTSEPEAAKDLKDTRSAAGSFGAVSEDARQTVRDNRAWSDTLIKDNDRDAAQGKLDDSDAALTDDIKVWKAVAGSDAAAGDAAQLTQASRDGVDALGDVQDADASFARIQQRAANGPAAGAPPSQLCASLPDAL